MAGEPLGWLESHWGRLESQWLAGEPLGWLESHLVGWRAIGSLSKTPLVATLLRRFHRNQSHLPLGPDQLLVSAVDKLDGPGV